MSDNAETIQNAAAKAVASGVATQKATPGATAKAAASSIPELGTITAESAYQSNASSNEGGNRKAIAIGGAVVGVLLAVYIGGALYFGNRFFPNTTVNGTDASLKLMSEVAESQRTVLDGYKVDVTAPLSGDTFTISAADINFDFDTSLYVEEEKSMQNAWAWPAEIFSTHTLTVESRTSYDEEALAAVIAADVEVANTDAVYPSNATVVYDEDQQKYVVQSEEEGNALDAAAVTTAVGTALTSGQTTLDLDRSVLVQPEVTSTNEQLNATANKLNAIISQPQVLTYNGEAVLEVATSQIREWIGLDENLDLKVDTDAITSWAKGDLSTALNSVGTARTYTRPDGNTYTVSGGTYGWTIDASGVAESIIANLQSGDAYTAELSFTSTADQFNPSGQDWPTRYIDVDLTTQHAIFYSSDGDVMWETDIVTGKTSDDHGTPEGVYTILNKATNQKLVSTETDANGEPTYISYVDLWMPFIGNLYAFHDANWRTEFGGTIYEYDGSHGCINLPVDAAYELWDLIEVGDVVVTHYS